MQLKDYDITTRYEAKIVDSERITPRDSKEDVRDISLKIDRPGFDARVGHNIGVLAPGQREIGQEHQFRLYSIADLPRVSADGCQQLTICVRRCSYIDEFSGEEYPGIVSNYLCDLRPGDTVTITGPYGQAFEAPKERGASLILIGAGTGIAPFRAFVKQLYQDEQSTVRRVLLFHGAQTGLDLLYRNDENDDFAQYYDRDTFEAFDALSKRPGWSDANDWGKAMHARGEELCKLLSDPKTYVYLAGLMKIRDELDEVLAEVAGSNATWYRWKAELESDGRWIELLY